MIHCATSFFILYPHYLRESQYLPFFSFEHFYSFHPTQVGLSVFLVGCVFTSFKYQKTGKNPIFQKSSVQKSYNLHQKKTIFENFFVFSCTFQ